MENDVTRAVSLGVWIGRGQVFGGMAYKSLVDMAKCLEEVRESGSYKIVEPDWEQFCPTHVGLTRRQVDTIIHNLKEFGDTYYQLSEFVNISPETYRKIAPNIHDHQIEIDGVMVPIAAENAVQIRDAVNRMRTQLRKAQEEARQANDDLDVLTSPEVTALQTRLDACFADMRRLIPRLSDKDDHALCALVSYSIATLQGMSKTLRANAASLRAPLPPIPTPER